MQGDHSWNDSSAQGVVSWTTSSFSYFQQLGQKNSTVMALPREREGGREEESAIHDTFLILREDTAKHGLLASAGGVRLGVEALFRHQKPKTLMYSKIKNKYSFFAHRTMIDRTKKHLVYKMRGGHGREREKSHRLSLCVWSMLCARRTTASVNFEQLRSIGISTT